jgi:hypothetical protein
MCQKWQEEVRKKCEELQRSCPDLKHWGSPEMTNPFFKATVHVASGWEAFLVPGQGDSPNAKIVEKSILDAVQNTLLNFGPSMQLPSYLESLQGQIKSELEFNKQSIFGGPVFQANLFEVTYNDLNLRDKVNWIVAAKEDPRKTWDIPARTKGICWALTFGWLKLMYKKVPVTASTYDDEMKRKIHEYQAELVTESGKGSFTEPEMAAKANLLLVNVGEGTIDDNSCHGVEKFQQLTDGCYYVNLVLNVGEFGHSLGVCFRGGTIYLCDQNNGIGEIRESVPDSQNGKMAFMKWLLELYTKRRGCNFPHSHWKYTRWEVYEVKGVTGQ